MSGIFWKQKSACGNRNTGGAWLSSARVVRCWVKSRNERNPRSELPATKLGTLRRLPVTNRRKVGMTSSQHAPDVLGYTRTTMLSTKGSETAKLSKSQKRRLSSDRRLQLACVKEESLVIAGQHTAVNPFPGLVHTARHTMEAGHARSRYPNWQQKGTPKAGLVTGVKS